MTAHTDSLIQCANCDNTGWVCQDHPESPWLTPEGKGHCYSVPGIPCECNPCDENNEPDDSRIFKDIYVNKNGVNQ